MAWLDRRYEGLANIDRKQILDSELVDPVARAAENDSDMVMIRPAYPMLGRLANYGYGSEYDNWITIGNYTMDPQLISPQFVQDAATGDYVTD